MSRTPCNKGDVEVITGDFCTDGKTFVFRLAGTPLSGTGDSPGAAFADLMRAEASAGALSQRLKELARDQQGEKVRATVIRASMAALIAFGVVGGALTGAAVLLPGVVAHVTSTTTARLTHWLNNMPPSTEERVSKLFQRAGGLIRPSDGTCASPAAPAADAPR